MNKNILKYVNKCEGWKVAIKSLHWDSNSLSQHELCDDIASEISDFEDLVSEVEQSISGKLKINSLNPVEYKIVSLKSFIEDVISDSQSFLKELDGMGKKYVGIKSECETFIGVMQRKLYLVNFTLKEELKNRLIAKINESRPKNLANTVDVERFMGRKPKSIKARINQIYKIVKKYGIDSKVYHDENWQAVSDYYRAISSLGCEVEMKPCGHLSNADSLESDGGYCDYDEYDHMPRSKQYAVKIMFEDGMSIDGYIKCMAAGTVSDPFSSYDTCIVLWPKNNRVLENKENMKKQIKLSEAELKQVIKEAATKILSETPLNYDVDNFSGRWTKNVPEMEFDPEDYLDNPYDAPNSFDDDEWVDGDKDMENDYSWDAFDRQAVAPGVEPHYNIMKSGVPSEVDKAISMRNRGNDWSERELRHGDRVMGKYVNGKYDGDDVGDAWDDLHYEGKNPQETINEIGDTPRGRKALARLSGDRMGRGSRLAAEYVKHGINDDSYMKDLRSSYDAACKLNDSLNGEIKKALDKFNLSDADIDRISKIINDAEHKQIQDDYTDSYYSRINADNYPDSYDSPNAIGESRGIKVNESELKDIVKEAAISLIREYNQKMARKRLGIKEGSDSIEIKPSKKGTFTAAATKHGKSVQGFANQVLKNKANYSPAMVKKANFAKNFGGKK